MIYCQLNNRVKLESGQPLMLCQVARIIAPSDADHLPVPFPTHPAYGG